ncbi:hypothetical protein BDW60DRAFT_143542 [Aspergillus nidulans var. acristatus]
MPKAPLRRKKTARPGGSTARRRSTLPAEAQAESSSHEQRVENNPVGLTEGPVEPISAVERRYRTFMRLGRPHDPLCFECLQPDDLMPCDTCRRSYHVKCMPLDVRVASTPDLFNPWHCPVCLARGWNDAARRPKLGPQDFPNLVRYPWSPQGYTAHPEAPPGSTLESCRVLRHMKTDAAALAWASAQAATPNPDAPERLPLAAEEYRTSMAVYSTANDIVGEASTPQDQNPPTKAASASASASGSGPLTTAPLSSSSSSLRKSRFNTLSDEVDSALSVVYRELEEVPLLRKTVADLEHKMAGLRQELSIYKNEIALSRRMGGGNDMKGLTAKKNDLERENADLRAQLEKSNQALKEWKEKLAGMLGE